MPLVSTTAAEAFGRRKANRLSLWPDGRRDRSRLSGIAEVACEPTFTLVQGEAVFTIGSCFARNIEARLAGAGFQLPTLSISLPPEERASDTDNDVLNKYPPHSMLNELRWALEPDAVFPAEGFLQVRSNRWHDPHLAGNVAPASLERVTERRAMVQEIYRQIPTCRIVVITLGLAEAWFDRKTGLYMNGAPPTAAARSDPERFRFDVLTVDEISSALEEIHALLQRHGHPDVRILLTVSPVPFKTTFTGRDAISANAYSKSALRAAAEGFVLGHDDVDYFPSYEVVTHTPRSAAYIQDNRHVTASVVNEIVDRVVEAYTLDDEDPAETRRSAWQLNDLLKAGEFETALPILRRVKVKERYLRIGWSPEEFHLNFGKTLARLGALAEAQVELEATVAMFPNSASANYHLGITLNKLQRPLEALRFIRRAVELNPDSSEMRLRYVRQLAVNRDFEEAASQLRIAEQGNASQDAVIEVGKELQREIQAAGRIRDSESSLA